MSDEAAIRLRCEALDPVLGERGRQRIAAGWGLCHVSPALRAAQLVAELRGGAVMVSGRVR